MRINTVLRAVLLAFALVASAIYVAILVFYLEIVSGRELPQSGYDLMYALVEFFVLTGTLPFFLLAYFCLYLRTLAASAFGWICVLGCAFLNVIVGSSLAHGTVYSYLPLFLLELFAVIGLLVLSMRNPQKFSDS